MIAITDKKLTYLILKNSLKLEEEKMKNPQKKGQTEKSQKSDSNGPNAYGKMFILTQNKKCNLKLH